MKRVSWLWLTIPVFNILIGLSVSDILETFRDTFLYYSNIYGLGFSLDFADRCLAIYAGASLIMAVLVIIYNVVVIIKNKKKKEEK